MAVPYETTGDLKRFSRRDTAFSRARWDETSAAYGKRRRPEAERIATGKAGYGREDFALHAASRTVQRKLRYEAPEVAADRYEPEDWAAFTGRVKRAALTLGASLAGVTRVNPLWVYASDANEQPIELPDGVDTAVVMAVEMDADLLAHAPAPLGAAATGLGYSRMAAVATSLATYLAELGWRALPSGNDTALSVPLAIDAGLGECGRHGMLITERFGTRVRLCKVFTDAPLAPDEPCDIGVETTCLACTVCAEACPVDAIPTGGMTTEGPTPSNNPGVRKWYSNPDTCLAFWRASGVGCSLCVKACPLSGVPKTI